MRSLIATAFVDELSKIANGLEKGSLGRMMRGPKHTYLRPQYAEEIREQRRSPEMRGRGSRSHEWLNNARVVERDMRIRRASR